MKPLYQLLMAGLKMNKNIDQISFPDLLPSSIAGDSQMSAAARALDGQLEYLLDKIKLIFLWSRIDTMEDPLLSVLANQLHVDYWDSSWNLDKKRDWVKYAIPWHRIKGTPAAVEKMLELILGSGTVVEWDEYDGEAYYFRVETTESLKGPGTLSTLLSAINRAKNTRSWLEKIIVKRESSQRFDYDFVLITRGSKIFWPGLHTHFVWDRFAGMALRTERRITFNTAE